MVDALVLGLQLFLGALMLVSGAAKLMRQQEFRPALADYRVVPPTAVPMMAVLVAALELSVGLGLLFGVALRLAGVLMALLLACFAAGMAINLARGRKIDCGCIGASAGQQISWRLVLRNGVLAAAACVVAAAPTIPDDSSAQVLPAAIAAGAVGLLLSLAGSAWRAIQLTAAIEQRQLT